MSALDFLKKLPSAVDPEGAAGVNCVVQFAISTPAYLTFTNGAAKLDEGTSGNADVTLTMEDDDLVSMLKGELDGMTAFMTGKLQLDGDMMLAQRFRGFFNADKLA
ncbi:MAG: SCP2 sterol-binding domain-containing protein [Nevskiaceae bacterium]|nr:MAG: SCP2 sterol-binding domain-containing protein [Nevskiaceae bacterium]TBR74816.1 MAG: SCP2 sterol-binding domain-containing protein [Nevskiaceae bacterium]